MPDLPWFVYAMLLAPLGLRLAPYRAGMARPGCVVCSSLALPAPQMAELAARLPGVNQSATFLTARQAAAALIPLLLARATNAPTPHALHPAPQPPASTSQPSPAIDIRDITFRYEDGTQALDRLSLAVPRGQFLAVVGRNGGGKSTLARHLNGLLRPQSGDVAIHGKPSACVPSS